MDNMTFFPPPEVPLTSINRSRERRSSTGEIIETMQQRAVGERALHEVKATFLSLRDGRPTTVLGALIAHDGQSLAEIESRLGGSLEVTNIPATLDALQAVGLTEAMDDNGIQRFSLVLPEA